MEMKKAGKLGAFIKSVFGRVRLKLVAMGTA